jgi:hypothetical protein
MKRLPPATIAALALLLTFAGCRGKLRPVHGQLVWEDGQPATELAGHMIYFECLEERTLSRSKIRSDGTFQLTTNKPENVGTDGAPIGRHRVYLIGGPVDSRFCRPDTSGLEVTVPPARSVVLTVARNRKKEQPLTPALEKKLRQAGQLKGKGKR